jgi:hypothetical protein
MAKQSLIAQHSAEALDMPNDVFGNAPMTVVPTKVRVPYALFAQPKATDQWAELSSKLPSLQDGDQVLVYPEPDAPVQLRPMRFTMLGCQQYWVQRDGAGNQIGKASTEAKSRAEKWNEEVLASCIVYVPRGGDLAAVPASCVFKTVKCPAVLSLKLQIEEAAKVTWADTSPAHKIAFAAFQKPWMRVVASVSTNKRTSSGGYTYVGARSVCSPATPAEYGALRKMLEDDGIAKLRTLSEHYHQRLLDLGIPALSAT